MTRTSSPKSCSYDRHPRRLGLVLIAVSLILAGQGNGAPLGATSHTSSSATDLDIIFLRSAPVPAGAAIDCIADWSDAAPVVAREGLIPVRSLHEAARRANIGDVVRVVLCSSRGRFHYRLMVREPAGPVVTRFVVAHPG